MQKCLQLIKTNFKKIPNHRNNVRKWQHLELSAGSSCCSADSRGCVQGRATSDTSFLCVFLHMRVCQMARATTERPSPWRTSSTTPWNPRATAWCGSQVRWAVSAAGDVLRPAGRLLIHPRRNPPTPPPPPRVHDRTWIWLVHPSPFMALISALTGLSLQKQAGHQIAPRGDRDLDNADMFSPRRPTSSDSLEVRKPPY